MKTPESRKAELVYISPRRIGMTNTKLNSEVLRKLAENFDWDEFQALPVYEVREGMYIPTDGNHRLLIAIARGEKWIPCVLLTKEEFNYVKFSMRSVDLQVFKPIHPKYII